MAFRSPDKAWGWGQESAGLHVIHRVCFPQASLRVARPEVIQDRETRSSTSRWLEVPIQEGSRRRFSFFEYTAYIHAERPQINTNFLFSYMLERRLHVFH